jgi:UDP-N-acetylglucosamine--N-acetylmuramyl-(pentapeptide) pyrophosphoryl-undecaprenol N-acetylglucosamine transferase
VLGGSQGAQALNETVPRAITMLDADVRPEIRHQAGKATIEMTRTIYKELRVDAQVDAFIDDIAAAYSWADLVICRAGALTISELAAAGLGAILVPYPSAVDDHQTHNAGYLVSAGAAVLLPQDQLTPQRLVAELLQCIDDRDIVIRRAMAARSVAQPDATRDVVNRCLAAAQMS